MSDKKSDPQYGRPIQAIIDDLKKAIPDKYLKQKELKGQKITYVPWYYASRILDYYAPGWSYEIRDAFSPSPGKLVMVVRISIPCAEGIVWRESSGYEEEGAKGIPYGDLASNAESMALRRAAAKFGLGRYLYERK